MNERESDGTRVRRALPMRVVGVDFSGSADAGRKIWVATGDLNGRALHVEACRRACDLEGAGVRRADALAGLRRFVVGQGSCAVGLDFPFSLPAPLADSGNWEAFAGGFGARYTSADVFRSACQAATAGKELKRRTDRETLTPFSPYNLRLFRQTYYGIRDVLAPLVADDAVCVVPMQRVTAGRPWLLEICPASTLKARDLYRPYKGRADEHRKARARIVTALTADKSVSLARGVRPILLGDPGGDALDSIIAAVAAAGALAKPDWLTNRDGGDYRIEGRVFV